MKTNLIHIIFLLGLLMACNKKAIPAGTEMSGNRIIHVVDATTLKAALLNAKPGDEIVMADGNYNGRFVIASGTNGTSAKPIILRGSRNAVLDGGDINTGYVLHLQSNYWIIKGFTVTNGLKGLMVDGALYSVIDGIKVDHIGEEGIHLRKFSSHNTIQHSEISNTGLKTADYGEGIYIGSAKNNWAKYSDGKPDLCDSNLISNNTIGPAVAAECIDIKEGTTGTIIRGNIFDAAGITGANSADSWIDVKGNHTLIENNTGNNPGGSIFTDGYQVHCAFAGWGNYNEFKNNNCTVNASGYGFNIQLSGSNGATTGNKVYSNNIVTGAVKGISNIPLSN
ncbi:MAG: chondroitinase-B domain-containing protein [Ferruginibacter sp.]